MNNNTRKRPLARSRILGCWIGVLALLLSSCPPPFDAAILNRVNDEIGPTISVSSPADGSSCANIVQVDGTVTDSATQGAADGSIASLAYEVLGTTVAGDVTIAADGLFTFQFTTVTFGDTFTLAITATDWNGNTTTEPLTLRRDAGSALPSFTAVPGNRLVTLEWDPVPNSASYTLRYTTNGALPSDTVGLELTDVAPGLELTGLDNGNLHVFQLFTVPEETWPESVSDFVQAVPLSEQTLSPRVTGEVTRIRVEWAPIPAEEIYEVWRSTEINGTYVDLSGPIRATEFFDTDVTGDTWYYYKIRPANYDNDPSAAGAAQLNALTIHEPVLVSALEFQDVEPGSARGYRVKVYGDYAYVADMEGGLQIVDISDPENVVLAGQCMTNDRAIDVAVSGDYAFVADGDAGLTVVNISDKSNPTVVTSVDTSYTAVTIALSDSYAYVADGDWVEDDEGNFSSIQIFDIDTPTTPTNPGFVDVAATAVAVVGDYLYAACPAEDPADFQIFTLTGTPTVPVLVNTAPIGDVLGPFTWGLVVQGNYAYIADRGSGVKIIDVTDRADPALAATCQTPGQAYDVVVDGSYAFVAAESAGLQIINISDPAAVDENSIIASRTTHPYGGGLGIARKGQYVYMAEWVHGLSALKASVPSAPVVAGTLSGLTAPLGIAVQGSHAYVADYLDGLRIVDVSQPGSPWLVSTLNLVDESDDRTDGVHIAMDVMLSGERAYVADKVKTVDISDPAVPLLIGSTYTNCRGFHIDSLGPYAYTSNFGCGLHVVDISADSDPVVRSLRDTTGAVYAAVARDSYAYVADGSTGFRIFDVSDPSQAVDVVTVPFLGDLQAISLSIAGDFAYVLETDMHPYRPDLVPSPEAAGVLRVIDISDPASPVKRGVGLAVSVGAQAVEAVGTLVYVVDQTTGLEIIDVSQPEVPFSVATVSIPNATEIAVSGRYAYVTSSDGNLRVIDLVPDL